MATEIAPPGKGSQVVGPDAESHPRRAVPSLDEAHNRVDLGTDRRKDRLGLRIRQAAKLSKYVYRGDMLITDDLGEDTPRLPADDPCAYLLSGKKSPALSLATFRSLSSSMSSTGGVSHVAQGTAYMSAGRASTACVINASRYYRSVLRSFKDRDTEAIWHRQRSRLLDGPTQRIAWRKLAILDAAETLADLRVPPGNRLEKLRGDREGQHSIRINQQWRICFSWSDAGPQDVEIVDYH